MKLFVRQYSEQEKCPSCLWGTYELFHLAETKEEAEREFDKGYDERIALCGTCIGEVIAEEGFVLIRKKERLWTKLREILRLLVPVGLARIVGVRSDL